MAYINSNDLMNGGKNYSNNINLQLGKNLNLLSTSKSLRILLFKECKLRDRQLLFDSHLSNNEESARNLSKDEEKNDDEFSYLTEMIFGSTALKYHDTYYKIHDVSSPNRLIFTQVFSTSNNKNFRINSQLSFSKSNSNSETDCSIKDYCGFANSLSQSSMDSSFDSFSIFRKNDWNANSTSTTLDSGFSESSFSSRSSFQPSYGSFTRREHFDRSTSSLNMYNSFENDSLRNMAPNNIQYLRLGLALIIPVTSKLNRYETISIHHITFIESILWRIRQYIELALKSPRLFLGSMLEIYSVSAKWLSNELTLWKRERVDQQGENCDNCGGVAKTFKRTFGFLNLRKNIFFRQARNNRFERFCQSINDIDVKETKFFLSTLLTAVLTHHTGWVDSCYSLKNNDLHDSYHAVWRQVANLYGTTGYLTKMSKTVIYGLKNKGASEKVMEFLFYFIRYFKIKTQSCERNNIIEENQILDNIFKNEINVENKPLKKRQGLFKSTKVTMDLSQMVADNETDFQYRDDKIFLEKINGSEKKKSSDQLCMLDDESELNEREDFSQKSVLFILGDNDKLQDLQKSANVKKEIRQNHRENENQQDAISVKLKVIKFPLPKSDPVGNVSEIIPYELWPENILSPSDTYIPDRCYQMTNISENKLKNILKNDLNLKMSCLFPNQVNENVAILGNTDEWVVHVYSSTRNRLVRSIADSSVDPSPLVSNLLEVILQMWELKLSKKHCAAFMEQRLLEICLKADALSRFLLTTDLCTMDILLTTFKLNIVDIPLLMSVASKINPEIVQKYGISYH